MKIVKLTKRFKKGGNINYFSTGGAVYEMLNRLYHKINKGVPLKEWSPELWDRVYNYVLLRYNGKESNVLLRIRDYHFWAKTPNHQIPERVVHSTNSEPFNVFRKDKIGSAHDGGYRGAGFYFKGAANTDGYGTKNIPSYLKYNNPAADTGIINTFEGPEYLTALGRGTVLELIARDMLDELSKILESIANKTNPLDRIALKERGINPEASEKVIKKQVEEYMSKYQKKLEEKFPKNFDSIDAYIDDYEHVVYSPNQIKSSNAITRTDSGEIIPISKRDDFENPDIRFKKGGKLIKKAGLGETLSRAVVKASKKAPSASEKYKLLEDVPTEVLWSVGHPKIEPLGGPLGEVIQVDGKFKSVDISRGIPSKVTKGVTYAATKESEVLLKYLLRNFDSDFKFVEKTLEKPNLLPESKKYLKEVYEAMRELRSRLKKGENPFDVLSNYISEVTVNKQHFDDRLLITTIDSLFNKYGAIPTKDYEQIGQNAFKYLGTPEELAMDKRIKLQYFKPERKGGFRERAGVDTAYTDTDELGRINYGIFDPMSQTFIVPPARKLNTKKAPAVKERGIPVIELGRVMDSHAMDPTKIEGGFEAMKSRSPIIGSTFILDNRFTGLDPLGRWGSFNKEGGVLLPTGEIIDDIKEIPFYEQIAEAPIFRHLPNRLVVELFDLDLLDLANRRRLKYGLLTEKGEEELQAKYNLSKKLLEETLEDLLNNGKGLALVQDIIDRNSIPELELTLFAKQGGQLKNVPKYSLGDAIKSGKELVGRLFDEATPLFKGFVSPVESASQTLRLTGKSVPVSNALIKGVQKAARETANKDLVDLASLLTALQKSEIEIPVDLELHIKALFKFPEKHSEYDSLYRKKIQEGVYDIDDIDEELEKAAFTINYSQYEGNDYLKNLIALARKGAEDIVAGQPFNLTPEMLDLIFVNSKSAVLTPAINKEIQEVFRRYFGTIEYEQILKKLLKLDGSVKPPTMAEMTGDSIPKRFHRDMYNGKAMDLGLENPLELSKWLDIANENASHERALVSWVQSWIDSPQNTIYPKGKVEITPVFKGKVPGVEMNYSVTGPEEIALIPDGFQVFKHIDPVTKEVSFKSYPLEFPKKTPAIVGYQMTVNGIPIQGVPHLPYDIHHSNALNQMIADAMILNPGWKTPEDLLETYKKFVEEYNKTGDYYGTFLMLLRKQHLEKGGIHWDMDIKLLDIPRLRNIAASGRFTSREDLYKHYKALRDYLEEVLKWALQGSAKKKSLSKADRELQALDQPVQTNFVDLFDISEPPKKKRRRRSTT